jgi:uncharacterized protein with HEPN domain
MEPLDENSVRTDEQRIGDIVERAVRALEYAHELGDAAAAQIAPGDTRTGMTRDAMLHCLVIMGMAASGLSAECYATYPDILWEHVIGLRQLYGKPDRQIDFDRVQHALREIVPALLEELR